MNNYDPMALAIATLQEIDASEFEDYRTRIKVRHACVHRLSGPVCTHFTGADGEIIWRVDSLDGSDTRYFVPLTVDIWA